MIKVGNILIDPNDISSIHQDLKPQNPYNNKTRGMQVIQVIYKNGVVKNFTSAEIGMSYEDFIATLLSNQDKDEIDRIFRIMAALKSVQNG